MAYSVPFPKEADGIHENELPVKPEAMVLWVMRFLEEPCCK